jgi:hypothetical protein
VKHRLSLAPAPGNACTREAQRAPAVPGKGRWNAGMRARAPGTGAAERPHVQPTGARLLEDNGMKKLLGAIAATALLAVATTAGATPSTVVWTPATTYTQPFLVPHITYDTYFGETSLLPVNLGLTVGFIPTNKYVEGEVGVDAFYPLLTDEDGERASKNAFQFNGKLSLKEGAFGAYSPGVSVGIANVGLVTSSAALARNDFNLLYGVVGKTFGIGTIAAGAYFGNEDLFLDENGESDEVGFMASYASPKLAVGIPGLKDVAVAADFASGSNFFSAVGAAVVLYFTDNVSLLTGPIWYLAEDSVTDPLYGSDFVWTAQLDVDIPFK